MISLAQTVITLQLREPMIVQTYLFRVVVTILIVIKVEYDIEELPWEYQRDVKGKIIEIDVSQEITRSGRCYSPIGSKSKSYWKIIEFKEECG